ncbi:regulator of MON1-CCZ1 complex [Danaus plexippus]|uniref:regulator of MON1-CCZ1 complex n=1 Tax=Danaus plexippus TaxID=13037 RepID=UPI002AAF4CFF|nr:regulator of MON1-CCZ1 complex [Danaus plexippus]
MAKFCLKDSEKYYLTLSERPKRFHADSPVTNVFFDDTNGQVFTVRSGGVTGVTVNGMDDSKCTSFRMEDKGPIISIKFSPDHKVLAIQRNLEGQNATVEFANFKDLMPTNVEYCHICKWKNAKILGFVWPKANEIAFITDHGIELSQVLPEKKQLKTLKSTSFSAAWFSWCPQSNIILLAGNNGILLQPFSLNNSTITKLQKLEVESSRPVMERDVFVLRLCGAAWCALFKHGPVSNTTSSPGPTEVWLVPISGGGAVQHVLKTGLVGRFAVSVIDDLVVIHHQSSQTSLIFDIMEEAKPENNTVVHKPIVQGISMRPAVVDEQTCPMYSGNWVVFQPHYVIDARLGCLWRLELNLAGLAHEVPKEDISNIVGVLLRRNNSKETIYRILNQLVEHAGTYLMELTHCFDEINAVYRRWADLEVARNTAGCPPPAQGHFPALVSQADMCTHVLYKHSHTLLVQVVTAYLSSLSRYELVVQHAVCELVVRSLVRAGEGGRLRALVRRGALQDGRPLACQLLSLGHLDPAAAQVALDMMWRLRAYGEIVEVLLSREEPVSAAGAARQAGAWGSLAARKLLSAAQQHSRPETFLAIYHALRTRNERLRGTPDFLTEEQCGAYIEYYKQLMSES